MTRYFDELKRRNVFRVAAAYAVVGWLIIEVIDTIAPRMAMPEWVPGFFIILVLIGFPIAMLFSWAFEMTPEGLKKTAEVDADQSITTTTGQRINYFIIAALACVVLFQQFAPSLSEMTPFTETDSNALPTAIAVLPFADLSSAGDQEYLGDGVAEEILNVLAGIDGLKVTSRTSAFAFKEQNRPIPEIAGILGVSHVVEGSIRKQGNRVRITAQLIEVAGDSHLWSEAYDSNLDDIFRLQDEIAGQISSALSIRLNLALPVVARETPDWDVGAYELYLRARQLILARTEYAKAIDLLDVAISIEPDFADAWAEKATVLALTAFALSLENESVAESYETYDQAWMAARHATDIVPDHPLGIAVQGLVRMHQKRWIEARVLLERAIGMSNPSDNAFLWLGILRVSTGDINGALDTIDAGLEIGPTAPNLIRWRGRALMLLKRWQDVLDQSNHPAEILMGDTLLTQQIASLHLGKSTVDDFASWLEINSTGQESAGRGPEAAGLLVAVARSVFDDDATVDEDFLAVAVFNRTISTETYVTDMRPDLAVEYLERNLIEIREAPNRLDLAYLWFEETSDFRAGTEFEHLVRDLSLPAYWDLYGWPDVCRPSGARDFTCE